MKQIRILLTTLILLSAVSFLFAEGVEHSTSAGAEFAYYFDNNAGYGKTGGFLPVSYNPVDTPAAFTPAADDYSATVPRSLGSGWGGVELQGFLKHRIKVPFLQGEGGLVSDNNVKFNFDLYAAPVAAYLKASATLTPIAFLNFNAGGMIGTGWNAVIFNGLGNNVNGYKEETSFPGIAVELFTSGTFQFDLAAIIPGDWTHVVTVASAEVKYSFFSTDEAKAGNPWQWLADGGENLNGWKLGQTYVLGYQMPLVLDMVGVLVETSQLIGPNAALSPMAGADGDKAALTDNGWGSDFVSVTFGPLANFTFDDHNSLTALVQFKSGIDYTDATIFNQYYQNRVYEGTYVKFNRIALAYTHSF